MELKRKTKRRTVLEAIKIPASLLALKLGSSLAIDGKPTD